MKYEMIIDIAKTTAIILIVMAGYYYFFHRKNAALSTVQKKAEEIVKKRQQSKAEYPVANLLVECNISVEFHHNATVLINGINSIFACCSNRLQPTDLLSDTVNVFKYEMDIGDHVNWETAGLEDSVDVFSFELLEFLEEKCSAQKWNQTWQQMNDAPKNENEWVEYISSMEICQMLSFFSPIVTEHEKELGTPIK